MKPFRFTLQALLLLRQRQERAATERYAAALLTRRKAGEALSAVEDEMSRASAEFAARAEAGAPAADLAKRQEHFRALETRHARAAQALEAAERAVTPALQQMLEARRQREVVEECREKQRERHQREIQRLDDKLQDEFALRRVATVLAWRGQS
jgi:flagellar export protein FliJ